MKDCPSKRLSPRPSRRRRSWRTGAATVEFALIAPVLFTIFVASVEFSRLSQVVNATGNAAYYGCRRAIVPGATSAAATTSATAILSAGLISNGTITINPSTISNTTTTVTVTVAVPMNNNGWTPPLFTKNMTITRACTMTREQTN